MTLRGALQWAGSTGEAPGALPSVAAIWCCWTFGPNERPVIPWTCFSFEAGL